MPRATRGRGGSALAIFALLAVIHTWPLATDPAHLSRNENGDTELNTWIVAWIAHQLPRDPLHLFDANIFHPEPGTLAFSEPLLVPGLMGAPLSWLGASPVLVYNLLLLLGFVLTAQAGYLLARAITGDHMASLLAGSVMAFNSHMLTRLPHLQAIHAEWLPLALLALWRLLEEDSARTRHALWLAVFVSCLALTAGYLAIMGLVALGVMFLARPQRWWGASGAPVLLRLGLAAALSAVVVFTILAPYARIHETHRLVRTLDIVAEYSATATSYLVTNGRFHYDLWSHHFWGQSDALFPGITAIGLSCFALVAGRRGWRAPAARTFAAIGLTGVVLSLGPATPIYTWLYHAFPPMESLRAASRFGFLLTVAVAILAACGLAECRVRAGARRARWIAIGAIVAATLEVLVAPIRYEAFNGIPGLYRLIADDPDAVVVEMPFPPAEEFGKNTPFVLASTAHWKPLLNGYSGFVPSSYRRRAEALQRFPFAPEAFDELHRAGVTHVVVHLGLYDPEHIDAIVRTLDTRSDLERLAVGSGGLRLYRLRRVVHRASGTMDEARR